ncbi:MAG: hypothetical protein HIU91_16820 [Acidobacteria bacterium]|nr:hypothetical protein [Acidobacteriota bacterium]
MGVELECSIAINWTSGVVLELGDRAQGRATTAKSPMEFADFLDRMLHAPQSKTSRIDVSASVGMGASAYCRFGLLFFNPNQGLNFHIDSHL